ncbi:MAG TPA: response regulator transcription factor, partial [Allocoleopsis sp.]
MRILLVEDDESLVKILSPALIRQDYVLDVATDGEMAWEMMQIVSYDLVILDVALPKLDGISLCQRLRSGHNSVLVMLLTARDTLSDKLLGLDSGADDYMVKPVNLQELIARIRTLLRRRGEPVSAVLSCGNLCLDPASHTVSCNGKALPFSRREYQLLELFLTHPHRVFSRGEIVDRIWALGEDPPTEDTIKSHIRSIR